MNGSRVDVVVVAYADDDALARCLRSLLTGDPSIHALVVDNAASRSGAAGVAALAGVSYLAMDDNVGFCRAVNAGIAHGTGDYVLLVNPDAVVAPDYVARLAERLDRDASVASVGGRILRGTRGSAIVDSLGIAIEPGRRPVDIGHGQRDDGRRAGVTEVFGVTAAAAMYRRSALERVRAQGQILADDYFMYMDDVDLAWRLRLAGFRSFVDHAALAWHGRAQAGGVELPGAGPATWIRRARHEMLRPDYVRVLSASNLLLTILRNDDALPFLRQWPRFVARRLPADGWMGIQRPDALLASRRRFLERVPAALDARREIQAGRVVDAEGMALWLP